MDTDLACQVYINRFHLCYIDIWVEVYWIFDIGEIGLGGWAQGRESKSKGVYIAQCPPFVYIYYVYKTLKLIEYIFIIIILIAIII